ncbi:uncharacterized protein [Penaeus vannamei]|uniref:uncharacterized protein n=1 Tax=Penaeus vannamei TaxID=6689 RepID=UPI00387F80CE
MTCRSALIGRRGLVTGQIRGGGQDNQRSVLSGVGQPLEMGIVAGHYLSFFEDLYNSNEQPQVEANAVTRDGPNITKEEITRALKGMKRGKAPGEDGISLDLIIDAGEIATVKLANLFNKSSQRKISEITYKLFTKVITARISDSLDSNKPREEAGFRRGFSTTDHTQIREKINEYRKPLLLEAIRRQGVEEILCKILEYICEDGTPTIKLHTETDKIPIKKVLDRATPFHQNCL